VFTKLRVGAFSAPGLADFLASAEIDTLVLAGVQTSGVVLSTVREAADRDYRLIVLRDCCADPDADVHAVLVGKVFPAQADIVEARELADVLVA
jgi:nicotinamidase-related amidase